jgi:hypothetical protein
MGESRLDGREKVVEMGASRLDGRTAMSGPFGPSIDATEDFYSL